MRVSGLNVVYVKDIFEELAKNRQLQFDALGLANDEAQFVYIENSLMKVYFYMIGGEVFFAEPASVDYEKMIAEMFCIPHEFFWVVIEGLVDGALSAGVSYEN